MSKRLTNASLIALMSLLVLSWSTCPSLYINTVRSLAGAEVHACMGGSSDAHCPLCEQEQSGEPEEGAPAPCPLCESIGSMHALVTVDAPASLEAPVLTVERLVVVATSTPRDRVADRLEPEFSPPDEQFATTVRFLC